MRLRHLLAAAMVAAAFGTAGPVAATEHCETQIDVTDDEGNSKGGVCYNSEDCLVRVGTDTFTHCQPHP